MAFLIKKTYTGNVPPWVYLPTTAGTYIRGDACVYSAGVIVPVSSGVGQDTDEGVHYICMLSGAVAVTGNNAPFVKCIPDIIWETTLGEASTNTVAVGLTYGIHTDARTANSVLTKGCFTLTEIAATTINSVVSGVIV